jgi:hypothetical protein
VAFTKGTGGTEVLMGDLVPTEDEVDPVMSALLGNAKASESIVLSFRE